MLIAKDIVKNYGTQKVLRGVSLEVAEKEFLSIMGESGSGKSTLLSILAGNARADAGTVMIDGRDITSFSQKELARLRRDTVGFVYQSLNLIPTLSGEDNILLPWLLAKKELSSGKERLMQLAENLNIAHLLKKFPEDMSGGERQRVAIARALINSPKILMLDEPTGSLDSKNTADVLALLKRINTESGITVIQVTHSQAAAEIGDRTITICDGAVVE